MLSSGKKHQQARPQQQQTASGPPAGLMQTAPAPLPSMCGFCGEVGPPCLIGHHCAPAPTSEPRILFLPQQQADGYDARKGNIGPKPHHHHFLLLLPLSLPLQRRHGWAFSRTSPPATSTGPPVLRHGIHFVSATTELPPIRTTERNPSFDSQGSVLLGHGRSPHAIGPAISFNMRLCPKGEENPGSRCWIDVRRRPRVYFQVT
ncbi:hypothetical protein CDEST_04684 [Colletotrichum destructivum]|uniref:Uncharacterized protein n=1 Tax=Colletotrichum destructivum TaxID=34406 RepID=A0AAX4I8N3_9PEZI|nr:hypothetical protein CDEST_04684 [Colletotrichum destructivum]